MCVYVCVCVRYLFEIVGNFIFGHGHVHFSYSTHITNKTFFSDWLLIFLQLCCCCCHCRCHRHRPRRSFYCCCCCYCRFQFNSLQLFRFCSHLLSLRLFCGRFAFTTLSAAFNGSASCGFRRPHQLKQHERNVHSQRFATYFPTFFFLIYHQYFIIQSWIILCTHTHIQT